MLNLGPGASVVKRITAVINAHLTSEIDYSPILLKNDCTYGKIVWEDIFRRYRNITVLRKKC